MRRLKSALKRVQAAAGLIKDRPVPDFVREEAVAFSANVESSGLYALARHPTWAFSPLRCRAELEEARQACLNEGVEYENIDRALAWVEREIERDEIITAAERLAEQMEDYNEHRDT